MITHWMSWWTMPGERKFSGAFFAKEGPIEPYNYPSANQIAISNHVNKKSGSIR